MKRGRTIKPGVPCIHRELIEQRSAECYNCTFNHLVAGGDSWVPQCLFDYYEGKDPKRIKQVRRLWELRRHVEGVNYDAGRRFYEQNNNLKIKDNEKN